MTYQMNFVDFCLGILTLSSQFEFSVTSWFRSLPHNTAVGGSENSFHLIGMGSDIVLDKFEDTVAFVRRATGLGFSVLNEGDHLHLQPEVQNAS